jgi:hypothetical protein
VDSVDVSYFGLYLFLDHGLMTSTLDDYLLYYECSTYLWYRCVMFLLLSFNPVVLVKSSAIIFLLRQEK